MIDLYTVPTANGQKVQIMLEETGLAYTPHLVDLHAGAHRQEPFLRLNPFARVPVIVDRDSGDFAVGETLAILVYLAEKCGRFLPQDTRGRAEVLQWLSGISANIGPLFRGLFMFTSIVPGRIEPAIAYFRGEAEKAFAMLDRHLADRAYLVGDAYTVADISAYPVAVTSAKSLPAGLAPYANLRRWVDRIAERPAVARGMALFAQV
jgi:GST-like protein